MSLSLFNPNIKEFQCQRLTSKRVEDGLFSRQQRIPGFDHATFSSSRIGLIGCGGLGGEAGEGLVRKGVGQLFTFDHDSVELSNLNRQFFGRQDIGKNKALRLARNLSRLGFGGTQIRGIGLSFQIAVEQGLVPSVDALICGVDNDDTRIFVCRYAFCFRIPVVYMAASKDGNSGMVFVQEPGKACYMCFFGKLLEKNETKTLNSCAPDPAVKDILKVVGGLVLYAVDSLFMDRKRFWDYREYSLAGFVGEKRLYVKKRDDCSVCGSRASGSGEAAIRDS
jgi:molybdopterin-synthase adenylyltransferase